MWGTHALTRCSTTVGYFLACLVVPDMVIHAPCLMCLLTQVILVLLTHHAVPILQRSADILVDYIRRFPRHSACQGNVSLTWMIE